MAGRIWLNMIFSLREMQSGDQDVDDLDADEGSDNAAEAVNQQVARRSAVVPTGSLGIALPKHPAYVVHKGSLS
jgi:hypothetical protein